VGILMIAFQLLKLLNKQRNLLKRTLVTFQYLVK